MLSLKSVRDDELLCELTRLVKESRGVEAEVIAHVAEVELRRLYAPEACSSMFAYCRRVLGMRENEAYLRITVARASREHPVLLEMLGDGRLHLSGIARLAPLLTRENASAVLERASGMSHREVRELVAALAPKPDVAPAIRKLPQRPSSHRAVSVGTVSDGGVSESAMSGNEAFLGGSSGSGNSAGENSFNGNSGDQQLGAPRVEPSPINLQPRVAAPVAASVRGPVVEPLAPGRYSVRFAASAELRDKLERLQALMRASVPDGDLARIIDIAVSEKLERVEARRFGQVKAPRKSPAESDTSATSRHIPAPVRRLVHARDGGRCSYRGTDGLRCARRHDLEFHHKRPFARGGGHHAGNIVLMCRAHNTLLAEQDYGQDWIARFRTARALHPAAGDFKTVRTEARPRSPDSE